MSDIDILEEGETYEEAELEEETEACTRLEDFRNCTKHPGHKPFILAAKFDASHLPVPCQNKKDWLRFVQLLCSRTVKIIRNYTSEERPKKDKHSMCRGKQSQLSGTGFIMGIEQEQGDCECSRCLNDETEHEDWWTVRIYTASHVLYNTEEVETAKVQLFFDDPFNKSKIETLEGFRMPGSVSTSDVCVFECVVHKSSLAKQIERHHREFEKLFNKLRKMPLPPGCEKLLIIVSHPHGKAKHVSIGEWQETKEIERPLGANGSASAINQYQVYKTPTCTGSSGAQVCDFWRGKDDTRDPTNLSFGVFVHSRNIKEKLGKSSFWLKEYQ